MQNANLCLSDLLNFLPAMRDGMYTSSFDKKSGISILTIPSIGEEETVLHYKRNSTTRHGELNTNCSFKWVENFKVNFYVRVLLFWPCLQATQRFSTQSRTREKKFNISKERQFWTCKLFEDRFFFFCSDIICKSSL